MAADEWVKCAVISTSVPVSALEHALTTTQSVRVIASRSGAFDCANGEIQAHMYYVDLT
jgi:hypothetical protein